jgi:GTP pyrophosphokinase
MDGLEIFDSKPDEMYYKIGIGLIKLDAIKDILRKWHERPRTVPKEDDRHYYIIASCCHPIPGDSVIGFAASDGTVTVHKRTCKTANNLAAKFGDKIVIPKWDDHARSQNLAFLVRLSLNGFDKVGMINEITRYISLVMNVNIRSFSLSTENGVFDGHIELYVHDMGDLDTLIKQLHKIEGIQSVVRTDL